MKKLLLGTTALTLIGFMAGNASAAGLEGKVNGYMRAGMAVSEYASNGVQSDEDFHVIRDGEIHLKGVGTLDNGLTIEGRVEIEAFTSGDQIDENWVSVAGNFGKIMIGGNDDAAYNMGYVGMSTSFGGNHSWYDHTVQFLPTGVGAMFTLVGGSDQIGIHYYTPNVAGFQAGVSYHPDTSSDGAADGQTSGADNGDQFLAAGANYRNTFRGFDFGIGGGYTRNDDDDQQYGIGLEMGAAGFTAYGRYEVAEPDSGEEATGYAAGLSYSNGPWRFAGGYGHQEIDGVGGIEVEKVSTGVTYELGAGVTLAGGMEYGDNEDDDAFSGVVEMGVSF